MITVKMIKDHIKGSDYLEAYGKGIKLLNVEFIEKVENSECIAKFEASTSYKAKKYENNVAKWLITVYKDGSHQIYFNGESYLA